MRVESSSVRASVLVMGCATLGTVAARPLLLMQLIPFPHHLHNWEYGTVSPVHSSPVSFRPDPAQYNSQSRRKYHFTTEKKTIFVVRMLQPPAALPRTSVLTQEMRLLSKHQSGAIYIASLKRYLKKHIDTSKNRKK